MPDPDPRDHAWLAARERGDDVSQVPVAERQRYEALEALIAELPAQTPSPGWRRRVLAALDQAPPVSAVPVPVRAAGRRRRVWIGGTAAAAAAIAVLIAVPRRERAAAIPGGVVAEAEVVRGTGLPRGSDAAIGDLLRLRVETDGSAEIRVYGDTGEPLARCDDTQGCRVVREGQRHRYLLDLPLRAPGDVRAVLFTGTGALPPPRDLDTDLAMALRAGIVARQIASQRVR